MGRENVCVLKQAESFQQSQLWRSTRGDTSPSLKETVGPYHYGPLILAELFHLEAQELPKMVLQPTKTISKSRLLKLFFGAAESRKNEEDKKRLYQNSNVAQGGVSSYDDETLESRKF